MIRKLAILGASGDLTARYLLPGLAALRAAGELSDDGVGALKDMLQNHLLQLLCLVAMEPPISLGDRDLRDRKVDVLRSVRPLTLHDAAQRTRRARYRGYVDEAGVDPQHHTETFAEVRLELDNWRWPGTIFRLRTG